MYESFVACGVAVYVIYALEIVYIKYHHGSAAAVDPDVFDGVIHFGLKLSVVVYPGEGVLQGKIFIGFESGHKLLGTLVYILYHEYKAEVIGIDGLGASENEFYPDISALKVLHKTVVGGCTSDREVLFQILGVCSFEEDRLIIGSYHINYHHAPFGVLQLLVLDIIRQLRDTYAVGGILYQVYIH